MIELSNGILKISYLFIFSRWIEKKSVINQKNVVLKETFALQMEIEKL